MVAPTDPGRLVGRSQDRLQLGSFEEGDEGALVALVRDAEDPLNQGDMLRMLSRKASPYRDLINESRPPMNALGRFLSGLAHDDSHLEQMRKIMLQARQRRQP